MEPSFNVYQIVEKQKNDGYRETEYFHKLKFLKRCLSLESAEHWLKGNHEKYTRYTILPEYCVTDFDD